MKSYEEDGIGEPLGVGDYVLVPRICTDEEILLPGFDICEVVSHDAKSGCYEAKILPPDKRGCRYIYEDSDDFIKIESVEGDNLRVSLSRGLLKLLDSVDLS